MKLLSLYVSYKIGLLSLGQVRSGVIAMLVEESDDRLFDVSYHSEADTFNLQKSTDLLFAHRGFSSLGPVALIKIFSAVISKSILAGEVASKDGVDLIARATNLLHVPGDFHELDTFRYASSEWAERHREQAVFHDAVLSEARIWAKLDVSTLLQKV